jgi:hypothetical protein
MDPVSVEKPTILTGDRTTARFTWDIMSDR